jgi:hypothetical protein
MWFRHARNCEQAPRQRALLLFPWRYCTTQIVPTLASSDISMIDPRHVMSMLNHFLRWGMTIANIRSKPDLDFITLSLLINSLNYSCTLIIQVSFQIVSNDRISSSSNLSVSVTIAASSKQWSECERKKNVWGSDFSYPKIPCILEEERANYCYLIERESAKIGHHRPRAKRAESRS